jgi:hypothetical protein
MIILVCNNNSQFLVTFLDFLILVTYNTLFEYLFGLFSVFTYIFMLIFLCIGTIPLVVVDLRCGTNMSVCCWGSRVYLYCVSVDW